MQNLGEALQVKDSSVFELVHHTFYERDFVFFAQLIEHLGVLFDCDKTELMDFAKLSQLLYLSSLLHFSLTEETEDLKQLRAEKQMPVLLGDLLYGRFISTLIQTQKSAYLPFYIAYLKQFNMCGVEDLEGRFNFTTTQMASVLMEKTAEVIAAFTGKDRLEIIYEAEVFFAEEWNPRKGNKITTMDELEALLKSEFGQGAILC